MWRPVAMAETRGFKIKRSDLTQDDRITFCNVWNLKVFKQF